MSRLMPVASLVRDWDLYPRASLDGTHVNDMIRALDAGIELPAVIADRASKRLIDGWHRCRATERHAGDDAKIRVDLQDYSDEQAMWQHAVTCNASHGRKLTRWDHARIKLRSAELGIGPAQVAVMIHRPTEYVERRLHVAVRRTNGATEPVALKRTMTHFEGQTLTLEQDEANTHASGWSAAFHANQISMLIEAEALPDTEEVAAALSRLRDLLLGLEF